jgi:sec-independent protein translocase protein TatA
MELSPMHLLLVLLIVLILFGGRRIPELMRGLGEGIHHFREGMRGDQPGQGTQPPTSNQAPPAPTQDKK